MCLSLTMCHICCTDLDKSQLEQLCHSPDPDQHWSLVAGSILCLGGSFSFRQGGDHFKHFLAVRVHRAVVKATVCVSFLVS